MTTWIALLRAVNVGGTGKLPMVELRALCTNAGFGNVRTWIASGNVVFESASTAPAVQATLESALRIRAGKPVGVLIRSSAEMTGVLVGNPFAGAASNRTVAIFLDAPPPADTIDRARGRAGEQIALGEREIYVYYGEGMAGSRLRMPAADSGTARNINTITTLAVMAAGGGDR